MSNIIDPTNKSAFLYAKSVFPQMIKICEPLKHLGIKHFGYIKIFRDSSYLHLTNGLQEYQEKYFENVHTIGIQWTSSIHKTSINSTCNILWPQKKLLIQFFLCVMSIIYIRD